MEQISDEVDLKELLKYNQKKGKGLVGSKRATNSRNLSPIKQDPSENIASKSKSKDSLPSTEKKVVCDD